MQLSAAACREAYRQLLTTARRCVRSEEEARDLTQDAVLIALARGFEDWAAPERRAWLHGVVRKRAAFIARSHSRRRHREAREGEAREREARERERLEHAASDADKRQWRWYHGFLESLPASLRSMATLVSADLGADEIRWLLDLSDTAWRQRLSALRRKVSAEVVPPTRTTTEPAPSFGVSRARVLAGLRQQGGRVIATRDPDGHSILLRVGAHKRVVGGNS